MKRLLLTLSLVLTLNLANAQSAPDYSKYPLEKEEDFAKAKEAALQTANYLLGNPVSKDPQQRLEAMQYLLMWMQGTPDYTFAIDGTFSLVGEDQQIMGLYLASMIKYHIVNEVKESNEDASVATLKTLAEYINNLKNNVNPTADLKKVVEAHKKGTLRQLVKDLNKK